MHLLQGRLIILSFSCTLAAGPLLEQSPPSLLPSFPFPKRAMTSSTLVETVSLNYEDFSESFLTCSTCLCTYDGQERTPKLLSCSHTVCRSCLERLVQATGSQQLRCPICREAVTLPAPGVAALPPSFLVNQLLDLVQGRRREVVPKCVTHPAAPELLFCETCDRVFCSACPGDAHDDSSHTVVPFSIAVKRMSEILLYKVAFPIFIYKVP